MAGTLQLRVPPDARHHAIKRQAGVALGFKSFGLGYRLGLIAQGDKDGRIVMGADAGKSARHGFGRRHGTGPVRGHNGEDGFSHDALYAK